MSRLSAATGELAPVLSRVASAARIFRSFDGRPLRNRHVDSGLWVHLERPDGQRELVPILTRAGWTPIMELEQQPAD